MGRGISKQKKGDCLIVSPKLNLEGEVSCRRSFSTEKLT